jgi:hypothetical protein
VSVRPRPEHARSRVRFRRPVRLMATALARPPRRVSRTQQVRCAGLDPGLATEPPPTVKVALSARRGTFLQTLVGKGAAIRGCPTWLPNGGTCAATPDLRPSIHGLTPTIAVLEGGFTCTDRPGSRLVSLLRDGRNLIGSVLDATGGTLNSV